MSRREEQKKKEKKTKKGGKNILELKNAFCIISEKKIELPHFKFNRFYGYLTI